MLSAYYWPEPIGSAYYSTDLNEWLATRGHTISAFTFRPHYPRAEMFVGWRDGSRDHQTHNGVSIARAAVNLADGAGALHRLFKDLRFFIHTVRFSMSRDFQKPDMIIAYVPGTMTLLAAEFLSRKTGATVLGVIHDIESGLAAQLGIVSGSFKLRLLRSVERFAFNRTATLVVLTSGMKAAIRKLGYRGKIETIPIWAPVSPYEPYPADAPPRIMYSGNFGKKQNLSQLVPLIHALAESRPNAEVVLRGDGSERAGLEKAVADARLTNVKFGPLVPTDELAASLRSALVHLIPQASGVADYAIPSKVYSVMAAGRPFVCVSPQGSALQVIAEESGAGICVPPDDPRRLVDAVLALVNDRERAVAMGLNAQRYVLENAERESVLARFEALIAEQTSQPSRASES